MANLTLTKEDAQAIVWGDHDTAEIVMDAVTGKSRWSVNHRLIFKLAGKFYQTSYSVGATEYQEEQPFQHQNEIICKQVEPYEKTVIDYREIA